MVSETELNVSQEQDPLSGAASGWEAPKFPVLMPGRICKFRISSSTKAPVKDDPSRQLLVLVLVTEDDYIDDDGKPLRKGFKVFHRIGLTPSPESEEKRGRSNKQIGADLAMVLKACGMADKEPKDLRDNPSMVEGSIVECTVGIQKEKDGFPKSNTVKFVVLN